MEKPEILLVHSDPKVLDQMMRALADEPWKIITAATARAALSLLEQADCKVVLTGLHVGDMAAVDFLVRLREAYPLTVRIVLSAKADFEVLLQIVNAGHIYRYVTRPATDLDLKVTVQSGVEYHHLRSEKASLARELGEKNKELARLNANLGKMVTERTRELRARDRILQHLLTAHSLQESMEFIAAVLTEDMRFERIAIHARQDNEERLHTIVVMDSSKGMLKKKDIDYNGLQELISRPEDPVHMAFHGNAPVLREASSGKGNGEPGRVEGALLAAPISKGELCLGVMEIQNPFSGKPPGPEDEKRFAGIAGLMAMAIEDHLITGLPNDVEDIARIIESLS